MAWEGITYIFLIVSAHLLIPTSEQVASTVHDDRQPPAPEHDSGRGNLTEKYLAFLPRIRIEGSTEVFCITLYNMTRPVYIKVLLTHRGDETELLEYLMEVPHNCLDFVVPELDLRQSSAVAAIPTYVRDGLLGEPREYILLVTKDLQVERAKVETFIETDKPIYKPGQTVKFRILSLDQNLRADKGKVDSIWVETPSGVRIAQWLSIAGEQGLISLELPMTSDPMLGKWKIFVEHRGVRSMQEFKVDEYVLPKFEVTIDGPSYLLVNETSIMYRVCGRYTYGQPVEGSVFAKLSAQLSRPRPEREPLTFESESTGTSGCVDVSFDIRILSLQQNSYSIKTSKLKLDVIFTELATGVEAHAHSEDCTLTVNAYKLKFVNSKKYFMKGLPYKGKVHLTLPDGTPVEDKVIRVGLRNGGYSEDVVTDSHGFANFVVANLYQYSTLEAFLPDMPSPVGTDNERTLYAISSEVALLSVSPQFSPSNSFLQISHDSTTAAVGSKMMVRVSYTGSRLLQTGDLSAVFIAKGNVLRPATNFSESQAATADTFNYRVIELRFEVTPEMWPLTKLLVYYVTHTGEVVADSVHFAVNLQFANQVDFSFVENEAKPGEQTELLISAAPNSICGVRAVDKSVYLLGKGRNNIQEKQVKEFSMKYHLDARSGLPIEKCKKTFPWWLIRLSKVPGLKEKRDSSSAFDDVGLLYATNLDLKTSPCPTYAKRTKEYFFEVTNIIHL